MSRGPFKRGVRVFASTDLALKSAQIVDFCGKWSALVDFENTVDRGSAVVFDADSGLLHCTFKSASF